MSEREMLVIEKFEINFVCPGQLQIQNYFVYRPVVELVYCRNVRQRRIQRIREKKKYFNCEIVSRPNEQIFVCIDAIIIWNVLYQHHYLKRPDQTTPNKSWHFFYAVKYFLTFIFSHFEESILTSFVDCILVEMQKLSERKQWLFQRHHRYGERGQSLD